MKKPLRIAFFGLIGLFALIGFVFTVVFVGMQFGLFDVRGSIADRNAFFSAPLPDSPPCTDSTATTCPWNATPEWETVAGGLQKDAPVIARVSEETGVPARLIAAVVIPEQIRFFTSEREVFKRYFEPLKILGSLSQFSLGVSGIKQDTADIIEENAASSTSLLYPGPGINVLLAYTGTTTHDTALFDRLTDPKNHYYSYLYTAIFIKEIESQWKTAGFDISDNSGIIATIFNIGFGGSHPNATPQIGGAPITVGGTTYSFGQLSALFYASDELSDVFPK